MNWSEDAIGGVVLLNVQAKTEQAAAAAAKRLGRSVLVGVMARDFPTPEEGAAFIERLHRLGVRVSAGLGDGSADQWENALRLALLTRPAHLNQIFPAAGLSQYALRAAGASTMVNGMIRPSGRPGYVEIGTGPLSREADTVLPAEAALLMLKETGVESVKFFPLEGDKRLGELKAVARAAARLDMAVEPTGGITPDNVARIVRICLDAGVRRIMPHLYGSLRNPQTGDLDPGLLERAHAQVLAAIGGA